MITDLLLALDSSVGFRMGWKRVRHIRNGHPHERSVLVEKLRSEKHPHTDGEYIYTVNIMMCQECGLTYNDVGLERRR